MTTFLGLRPNERTAFFIDGANLYKCARSLGFDIDYRSLLAKAHDASTLVRAFYYTPIQEEQDQEYSPLRPLVDWLDYNGFMMVTKPVREYADAQGRKRYKGSTDVELAVDMLLLANRLDHIVLFSGNGDFRRAVEAVQSLGVRVSVISTIRSTPPMASDELRRQADSYFDLADLEKVVGRTGGPQKKAAAARSDDFDDYDEYDDDIDT